MSTFFDDFQSDNSPGHGIICRNCIAKNFSNCGSAVRSVHVGTLAEVYSGRPENYRFHIVHEKSMQIDPDMLVTQKTDIILIPENLLQPLFTLQPHERLKIAQDQKLAEDLSNIIVDNVVHVLGDDDREICFGRVRFRNNVAKLGMGVYFGVEILHPKCNNDRINQISLLPPGTKGFPRGCDILVKVDRLRPLTNSKDRPVIGMESKMNLDTDNHASYRTMLVLHLKEKSPAATKKICNVENTPLTVSEQVVWVSDNGPERGVVKWLGTLKGSFHVGVEFENPIGSGCGTLEGRELFKAKYKHASILPAQALMRLSDFEGRDNKYINSIHRNSTHLCERRLEPTEDKLKSSKNPQYTGLPFHLTDANNMDEMLNNRLRMPQKGTEIMSQHTSKSFDLARPTEKKLTSSRHCISMDSDFLMKKDSKHLVNFSNHTMNSPSQDILDFVGQPFSGPSNGSIAVMENNLDHEHAKSTQTRRSSIVELDLKDEFPNKYLEQCSPTSSSDDSAGYYDTPGPPEPGDLGKGSLVEIMYDGRPHYGVIRWIGRCPDGKDRLVAGIEMEEEDPGFTDGSFNNQRLFQCNPNKACFVPLRKCQKDSRFSDEHLRQAATTKLNTFGQIDCPVVEGTVSPINCKGDVEHICGKNRGIQGHHNSCYLDATLFAMFAFTGVFDSLLYRPPTKQDIAQYDEVQRVLRDEIVNPLRRNLYVRADRVMRLRTLMEKLSSVTGLTTEEKDPEEFLNSLVAQILKAEPFLKLSSGQEAFHYQLFVEKDERLTFPTVQQLFEQSFLTSDIKLKQVPSCLIIQMPRFGKSFKMYPRILPSQLLDVTDIIENSPRQCTVCGKLAELECKDCFGQHGIGTGLESISFCSGCLETAHSHHCRARHNFRPLTVPAEFAELQEHCVIPRLYMNLFAVVCIETSHYVAFVKCGSGEDAPWCFFDSMADRKGEQNGYNIPEMVSCPDLPYWLSEDGARALNEMRDERQMPELAKRLLCDAYMCLYQSPEMVMYR